MILFLLDATCIFLRSEEEAHERFKDHEYPLRPRVRMDQLWALATTWYPTRLQDDSRRPQPDVMCAIYTGLGLEGDFWDPKPDRFGQTTIICIADPT